MRKIKSIFVVSLFFIILVLGSVMVFAEESSPASCEEETTTVCVVQEGRSAVQTIKILSNCDKVTSGSWCGNGCDEGACIESTFLKEQVKCVFDNSNDIQKCYTDDGKFGCSGTGTCVADVSGEKGIKLAWKSSCGEYAYTVVDGDNDYAEFTCVKESEVDPVQAVMLKEQVKCVFVNSDTMQKCYTDDGKF